MQNSVSSQPPGLYTVSRSHTFSNRSFRIMTQKNTMNSLFTGGEICLIGQVIPTLGSTNGDSSMRIHSSLSCGRSTVSLLRSIIFSHVHPTIHRLYANANHSGLSFHITSMLPFQPSATSLLDISERYSFVPSVHQFATTISSLSDIFVYFNSDSIQGFRQSSQ